MALKHIQLLMPSALVREVLTQVHHEHGHQGVQWMLALLRSDAIGPVCPLMWLVGVRNVNGVK